jgi:TPR repeat protein
MGPMLRVLLIVFGLGAALPVLAEPIPVATYEQGMTALESKDYPSALRIFRKVAATKEVKQKYRHAFYRLGMMYLKGVGVKKDEREAYRLLEAAQPLDEETKTHGPADAWYQVAVMDRDGIGTNKEISTASIGLARAVALGHKKAAFEAAMLALYDNSHLPNSMQRHDRIYALRMLFIARMDNDVRALPVLVRHCKRLNAEEIATAREDAQAYFKKDVRPKLVC